MTVTKLVLGKKNKDRVNIYLNEVFALSLSYAVCLEAGLKKGMELDEEELETLRRADLEHQARQKALALLARRPHSQKELAQKLKAGGMDPGVAESAVGRIAEKGWQSDREYAEMMARHLIAKGASNRGVGWELGQKGVSKEIIGEILSSLPGEEERIRSFLEKKTRGRAVLGKKEKSRLIQSLLRLGYAYDGILPFLSEFFAMDGEER